MKVIRLWFKVDIRSSMSLNEQIKLGIKESILRDRIRVGETLPSIREMASTLRVNPNTVIRAYKDLEVEGIIMARQGIGYVVLKDKKEIKEIVLRDIEKRFSEEIFKFKNMGFELKEIMEVIKKVWEKK